MKVVLDTNVLISGIFWGGQPGHILKLWAESALEVFVTPEILLEYKATIEELEHKYPSSLASRWLVFIVQNSTLITPVAKLKISRDPDDDKFVNCALTAKAHFIVSGDRDLLSLKNVSNIEIVTPSAFLKRMGH